MRRRISSIRTEVIQGISIFVGLLVLVVGGFILQDAYGSWHSYYMVPSNEYHLQATIGRSIEAVVVLFIATLIFMPEKFYGTRSVRITGLLFGGVSSFAALMVFPMAFENLRLLFLRGLTWEHLVSSAAIYSVPAFITALCSAVILFIKAVNAGH